MITTPYLPYNYYGFDLYRNQTFPEMEINYKLELEEMKMADIYTLLIFLGTVGAIALYMYWHFYQADNYHHGESKQHR